MFGTIIGDIIGSRFEGKTAPQEGFELFTPECRFTDDTLMTLAVAKAIMQTWQEIKALNIKEANEKACPLDHPEFHPTLSKQAVFWMQKLGRDYPDRGFSTQFFKWLASEDPKPYNSFGNGAAMRVSPVAYIARSKGELLRLARTVTEVTHNHPEGIKGAQATALAIWYALSDDSAYDIRAMIFRDFYPAFEESFFDDIHERDLFDTSCQGTVPYAILAFVEGTFLEDTIRYAISLGGDTDTMAAIAGSIASAYSDTEDLQSKAYEYLDPALINIIMDWEVFLEEMPDFIPPKGSWKHIGTFPQKFTHHLNHFCLEALFYYPSLTEKQSFITEKITLNDEDNELAISFSKPDLGEINHLYHLNQGLDELLATAEDLLEAKGWVDTPIRSDEYFRRFFKLRAEFKNGETIHRQGLLNRAHVPEKAWENFSESILNLLLSFGFTSIFNEGLFLNAKKPSEVMICNVLFSNYGTAYQYQSNDETLSAGDFVLVPVGNQNLNKIALVESIRFVEIDSDLPFPLSETKFVIRKVEEEEIERHNFPDL